MLQVHADRRARRDAGRFCDLKRLRYNFGQAKIENLGVTQSCNENVRRLDVAMNDSLGMRCFERFRNLNG